MPKYVQSSRKDRVISKIVASVGAAILAYIKPACIHRFSHHREILTAATYGSSQITMISKAVDRGLAISAGSIGADNARLGDLMALGLREGMKWFAGFNPIIGSSIPLALISASTGIALGKGDMSTSSIVKGVQTLLNAASVDDALSLYNALRAVGYEDVLRDLGLTRTTIQAEDITLRDMLILMENRLPEAKALARHDQLLSIASSALSMLREQGDLNNAIVYAYCKLALEFAPAMPIADGLREAIRLKLMANRRGARLLYDIDVKARKAGVDLLPLIPPLVVVTCYLMLSS